MDKFGLGKRQLDIGEPGENESILLVKINNKTPIELLDLTESLYSLGDEYKNYLEQFPDLKETKEFKLVVKEIKSGSIETALLELAPLVIPFAENTVILVEFSKYLYKCINWFTGAGNEKPELNKRSYDNLSKFVNPVAKDNGSQMNIQNIINGNVEINFNYGSLEANAIQNRINIERDKLKEPEQKYYEKVVLYWYQARDEAKTQIGDKAIIEGISPRAIKVIFAVDEMKDSILHDTSNPFLNCYVVDVIVETVNNKPVAYKILKVHEKFPRPNIS